jgi:hypothetical protein
MRISLVLTIALLFAFLAQAQKKYKLGFNKSRNEFEQVFPSEDIFKRGGWLFGGGVTGLIGSENTTSVNGQNLTTTPQIIPGLKLEVGRYYNFKRTLSFTYFDYSLSYKGLFHGEDFDDQSIDQSGSHTQLAHYASGSFNLNSTIPIGDYNFIQNSIGVNAGYAFIRNQEVGYARNSPFKDDFNEAPQIVGQVHYQLGFGIMLSNNLVLLPYAEVPVFNAYPQTESSYQLDIYHNQYVPLTIGVKIMPFNLADTKCPDVNNPKLPGGFKNGYGDD